MSKKQNQTSANRTSSSSSSSRSPNPGSAIASLVLASTSNHVQHQVKLWNQKQTEEPPQECRTGSQELEEGGKNSPGSLRMTDANISNTPSESLNADLESSSPLSPLPSVPHSTNKDCEIVSLDSATVSSASSSSSSARGTLSSASVVSTGDNRINAINNNQKKVTINEDDMMKNPFRTRKNEPQSEVVGQALAGILTGGHQEGSITSMDAIDPSSSVSTGNPSVINPILAREARTRSFLVGNLGCHDGILGCEELTRFFPSGKVNIMIITWNMSGNHPPSELNDLLLPETLLYVPDIYAIALQEMVFGEGKEIETQLQTTIGPSHVLLHSHIHGVLGLLIFVRRDLIWFFSLPEEAAYNVRPASMNMVKTKGAVGVSFSFFGTTFLFINSHLPAHEARNKERREAYERIISSFDLPRNLRPLKPRYISSDVTARFDVCFWFGDLNFRVERPYEETIQILEEIKAQKELIKSGCGETGRIKRILGGRFKDTNSSGSNLKSGNEDNASNKSLQGSVSSVDSTGLEVSGGHSSSPITRRTSEPGTSSGMRGCDSKSDTHSADNCYECLLRMDQLIRGMEDRSLFQGFQEVSEITFAPTFKYDINGDGFDVEYHRVPSYTDRILARSKRPGHVSCLAYDSIPDIKTSDHKPVFAVMECQIRPGKDTIPLNAGLFKRDTYIEALRRRAEENFGSPTQASGCGVS